MSVLQLLFLLFGVLALVNGAPLIEERVIGGEAAALREFPWQVSLRRSYGRHFCGGSLISTTKVLTAAHCIISSAPADISVVTGSNSLASGGEFHAVSRIVYHEDYVGGSATSWRYDIAIITLATVAAVSEAQYPIPLSTTYVPGNSPAVTSGWGRSIFPGYTLPTALQRLDLTILSNEECQSYHNIPIYVDQICVISPYGQGVCSGDSGGPLVVNGEVVGITSWGRPCGIGFPDVFARVSSFTTWITQHLNDV